jgi:hypothetical protein
MDSIDFTAKLNQAMALVSELNKTHGVRQRGGKMYTQVVHRMEAFRQVFGTNLGVDTQVIVDDGQRVVVKAIITDSNGMTVGAGMAEEIRGQGHVNTTSALENCETSAVGRALSSLGLAGGEYASANEMDAVVRKTDAKSTLTPAAIQSSEPKAITTPISIDDEIRMAPNLESLKTLYNRLGMAANDHVAKFTARKKELQANG